MPRLQQFTGGLHTAKVPHLIGPTEAAQYVNVNHISGPLFPIHTLAKTVPGATAWGHKFTQDNKWYFGPDPLDFVEYQERLYIGNRQGKSAKIVNGQLYLMGIEKPLTPVLTTSPSNQPVVITNLSLTLIATPGNMPADTTFRYKCVNVDTSTWPAVITISEPFEIKTSNPSLPSIQVAILTRPADIKDYVNVYREYEGVYRFLFTIFAPGPGIPDVGVDISLRPSISEFEDNPNAVTINDQTRVQYAYTFYNSNEGIESAPYLGAEVKVGPVSYNVSLSNIGVSADPQVTSKRIYRIGRNLTAFTLVATIGNATTFYIDTLTDEQLPGSLMDAENNLPPPAGGIQFLTEAYAMLFAITNDKLVYTPIGKPEYWPATYFIDFPKRLTGIAKTPIGLLVFDKTQTWLVTGTGPLSLSKQILTSSQGCTNGNTVANIQGAAWWVSYDGVCVSDGSQIKVYTREKLGTQFLCEALNAVVYNDEYYLSMLNKPALVIDTARDVIREVDWPGDNFILYEDELYRHYDGDLWLYTPRNQLATFTYKSPIFIGEGLTSPKTYKNFYVASIGNFTFTIFIDGNVARVAELTGTANHQIKIPTEFTRGFGVQFLIEGQGSVLEIYWDEGDANV